MQPSVAAKLEYSFSVLQFLAFLRVCQVHCLVLVIQHRGTVIEQHFSCMNSFFVFP